MGLGLPTCEGTGGHVHTGIEPAQARCIAAQSVSPIGIRTCYKGVVKVHVSPM